MKTEHISVAFIGGGNMANAIFTGILNKLCSAQDIHIIEIDEKKLAEWKKIGITASNQADSRLSSCNVWIYAVKPQEIRTAVDATYSWLQSDTLIISIVAGLSIDTLRIWLKRNSIVPCQNIVRCMPNTPALFGNGVTVSMGFDYIDLKMKDLAHRIFKTVGEVYWVNNDEIFHAVTALSGSGPAYVFSFLEAIIAGGIELGLSEQQSFNLAVSTFFGSVKMIMESKESPLILCKRVTSKGGTTEAALNVFNDYKFSQIIKNAMRASANCSKAINESFSLMDEAE